MIFNTSRCGWQWKDLSRFICLKIWPRLPKQSTRAIRISNRNNQNPSFRIEIYELPDKIINNTNINHNNNVDEQSNHCGSDVFSPTPQHHQTNGTTTAPATAPTTVPPNNGVASSDDTMRYWPINQ